MNQSSSTPKAMLGTGAILWSPGRDGYTDGAITFQGARAYDPQLGNWTTPDAFQGVVSDPMSQKPYVWNGNNAVTYSDPSGYDVQETADPFMEAMLTFLYEYSSTFAYIYDFLQYRDTKDLYSFAFRSDFTYGGRYGGAFDPESRQIEVGSIFGIANNLRELSAEIGHAYDFAQGVVTGTLRFGTDENYAHEIYLDIVADVKKSTGLDLNSGKDDAKFTQIIQARAARIQGERDPSLLDDVDMNTGLMGDYMNVERFNDDIGAM